MYQREFNLDDFMAQMMKMKSMGSIKDLMKLVPSMSQQMDGLDINETELDCFQAIVQSMTPRERRNPDFIEASRCLRIAKGSGTDPKDVSGLIKSFGMIRDIMKAMSNMSIMDRINNIKNWRRGF